MEFIGRRILLGGHDVANGAQRMGLLGVETQLLRKLIALAGYYFGRLGVVAEQRGRLYSQQLRFQSAKSACLRNAKRCLGDL